MRQFVSKIEPDSKGSILLFEEDFKHFKAIRAKIGAKIEVRLPSGKSVCAEISKIDAKLRRIELCVCSEIERKSAELKRIWLFQFVPKTAKFDLIVRQAAECGVERVYPVVSEFSRNAAAKTDFRSERFERIVREARQQSGSAVETLVMPSVSVSDVCNIWKSQTGIEESKRKAAVLWEQSEKTQKISEVFAGKDFSICALAVGSEGGISKNEIEQLCSAGFVPVHFKTNILRCETAALYGLAVLQNAIEN